MMVNGPTPTEHRVVAATWCLVQHHAQMHGRQPSLFAGNWRQLLPRPDDPPQLLSLKVKALSACLAGAYCGSCSATSAPSCCAPPGRALRAAAAPRWRLPAGT